MSKGFWQWCITKNNVYYFEHYQTSWDIRNTKFRKWMFPSSRVMEERFCCTNLVRKVLPFGFHLSVRGKQVTGSSVKPGSLFSDRFVKFPSFSAFYRSVSSSPITENFRLSPIPITFLVARILSFLVFIVTWISVVFIRAFHFSFLCGFFYRSYWLFSISVSRCWYLILIECVPCSELVFVSDDRDSSFWLD
jgi:hypothetical protein